MESCVNWDGPIDMVPCLHQGNIYTKSKLRVWRDQKRIPPVGAKTILTCEGHQNTLSYLTWVHLDLFRTSKREIFTERT